MKKYLLATAVSLMAMTGFAAAQTGADIAVSGVWSLNEQMTSASLSDAGLTEDETDGMMSLIGETAVVFDDEEDLVTVMLDAETVVAVCGWKDTKTGVIEVSGCVDEDGNPAEGDPGKFTIWEDGKLTVESDGVTMIYTKAEG